MFDATMRRLKGRVPDEFPDTFTGRFTLVTKLTNFAVSFCGRCGCFYYLFPQNCYLKK
jgi:hypothetical protein